MTDAMKGYCRPWLSRPLAWICQKPRLRAFDVHPLLSVWRAKPLSSRSPDRARAENNSKQTAAAQAETGIANQQENIYYFKRKDRDNLARQTK